MRVYVYLLHARKKRAKTPSPSIRFVCHKKEGLVQLAGEARRVRGQR